MRSGTEYEPTRLYVRYAGRIGVRGAAGGQHGWRWPRSYFRGRLD